MTSPRAMTSPPAELRVARVAHSHGVLRRRDLSGFLRALVAEDVAAVPTMMLDKHTQTHRDRQTDTRIQRQKHAHTITHTHTHASTLMNQKQALYPETVSARRQVKHDYVQNGPKMGHWPLKGGH